MTPSTKSTVTERRGSEPISGEPAFLVVGKLRRPHGVRGDLLMEVITDFPERLIAGITLYIGPEHIPMQLERVRRIHQGILVGFRGCSTPESAGELRNQLVYVLAADRPPLAKGEYYHHQLIGLQVLDHQGGPVGQIIEILETGANDVFVVRPSRGRDILIPHTDEVVLKVDLERSQMIIRVLPGLLSDIEG